MKVAPDAMCLRENDDSEGADVMFGGRPFQTHASATKKARWLMVECDAQPVLTKILNKDDVIPQSYHGWCSSSTRYDRAVPWIHLYTKNWIRSGEVVVEGSEWLSHTSTISCVHHWLKERLRGLRCSSQVSEHLRTLMTDKVISPSCHICSFR